VGDVEKAVLLGDPGGPAFDLWPFDFDGAAAVAADKVMVVVAGGAAPVASFAVVAAERVELAGVGEGAHLVIDGGERDVLALGLELGMKLLSRAEAVGGFSESGDRALLPGRALLGRPTRQAIRVGSDHHGVCTTRSSVLVPVVFVGVVGVSVVEVVGGVGVLALSGGHAWSSCECRMASLTM
jgi:hypothetical protein